MKANADTIPEEIQDLGNGTYFRNTNVVERIIDNQDGSTRITYDYDQELFYYDTAPAVPEEVAAWRLKAIVAIQGLKPAIDAALASLPEPDKTVATLAWYEGTTVRRDSPLLASMATGLGITDVQLDAMFIEAEGIAV